MADKSMLDVLPIVVGPFIGAGLAFLSVRVHDAHRQRQENIAAGNIALVTLKSMMNEYLLWRVGAYADMADPKRPNDTPLWTSIRPSFQSFGEYSIDLKSLSFLFEDPAAADSLNAVLFAEMTYRDMVAMEEFRNDAAGAVYEVLATTDVASHAEAAEALGPQRIETMLMALSSVATRARDGEKAYTNAILALHVALEKRLDKWWVRKKPHFIKPTEPLPHFRRENLPQLPARILAMLEAADGQRAAARAVPQGGPPAA